MGGAGIDYGHICSLRPSGDDNFQNESNEMGGSFSCLRPHCYLICVPIRMPLRATCIPVPGAVADSVSHGRNVP
jgi:hypothetical protein